MAKKRNKTVTIVGAIVAAVSFAVTVASVVWLIYTIKNHFLPHGDNVYVWANAIILLCSVPTFGISLTAAIVGK